MTTGRSLVANATGSGLGLSAFSASGTGAVVGSATGMPLVIQPSTKTVGAPTTGFHPAGALFVDQADRLYYNTQNGTPGSWIRLDTPSGVALLDEPQRAYDSRPTEPGSGPKVKFAAGQTRVIDLTLDPPPFASVNWTATGQTIGNNAQSAISDGKIKVFTIDAAHVIIDMVGFII